MSPVKPWKRRTPRYWALAAELAQALKVIRDSGLLNGPTLTHDLCRNALSDALNSYYDADNVR